MASARGKSETAVKSPRKAKPTSEVVVHAIKGFDENLCCLGHQYEIGKTYEHKGPVRLCAQGFHSIDGNPLDVLDYYPLIGENGSLNRFCSVVASGEIGREARSSKIVSGKLTVSVELTIPELVRKSVAWVIDACKSGDNVQAASGDYSKLAASGYSSKLAASGDYSQLAASGHSSQLAASGNRSQLAASGYSSKLAASGYSSKLAASGDSSQLAASGHYSQLAASGSSSQLAASGDYSKLAASGGYSKLEVKGAASAAAVVGPNSIIRAIAGTPVAICEYDHNSKPIGFATGIAGKDGVPADTWLIAKGGKLVEAK